MISTKVEVSFITIIELFKLYFFLNLSNYNFLSKCLILHTCLVKKIVCFAVKKNARVGRIYFFSQKVVEVKVDANN